MFNAVKYYFFIFIFPAVTLSAQSVTVDYAVDLTNSSSDRIGIEMSVSGYPDSTAVFYMPAWAPGDYIVTNYGRFVASFCATGKDSQELPVERRSLNEWFIPKAAGLSSIRLLIKAFYALLMGVL